MLYSLLFSEMANDSGRDQAYERRAHMYQMTTVCTYSAAQLTAWAAADSSKIVCSCKSASRALRMLQGVSIPGQHYLHALLKKVHAAQPPKMSARPVYTAPCSPSAAPRYR